MNVIKKMTITGSTCIVLGIFGFFSTVSAASNMEEFLGEGISHPSVSDEHRSYQGDNSVPSAEELMGEGIFFPQAETKRKYVYDTSTPSSPEMMSEGLVLSDGSEQVEGKQVALDVAVK